MFVLSKYLRKEQIASFFIRLSGLTSKGISLEIEEEESDDD